MRSLLSVLFLALWATIISHQGWAHEYRHGPLLIGHPWARATPGQAENGAVYLSVANSGRSAERLTGASSPAADKVELHTHTMEDDVMQMRPVAGIDIPANDAVVFMPGGFHIMLLGLKAPLKEGATFPLTLTFRDAGTLTVDVKVESAQSNAPGGHHQH